MEATFTFRKTDASEAIKEHAKEKLSKLDKYMSRPVNAHVIFNIEGSNHTVEVAFQANGNRYFGKGESHDMYTSIDDVVTKIEHQLRKSKERAKSHKGE